LFTTLPVASAVHRGPELPVWATGFARDSITLGWEQRLQARARRTSDGGLVFGTALPRGTVLCEGDWLLVEPKATAVEVHERAEAVLLVEPATPYDWGAYAYYIGNSHQPVMITDTAIVCADLPGMEQVLTYHGIAFRRALMAFTPLAMNVGHAHQPR
jgi:urease accessory protein UreE